MCLYEIVSRRPFHVTSRERKGCVVFEETINRAENKFTMVVLSDVPQGMFWGMYNEIGQT